MLRAPVILALGSALAWVSVSASAQTSAAGADAFPEGNVLVLSKTSASAAHPVTPSPMPRKSAVIGDGAANETSTFASQTAQAESNSAIQLPENTPNRAEKTERKAAGRIITLELPLKYQSLYLGDVTAKLSAAGEVSVKADSLAQPLKKVMNPAALSSVLSARSSTAVTEPNAPGSGGVTEIAKTGAAAEPSPWAFLSPASLFGKATSEDNASSTAAKLPEAQPSAYLPLDEVKKRGLDLRYDPLQSEILVNLSADQKLDSNVSVGGAQENTISANAQKPAFISAYLNARMMTTYVAQSAQASTGLNAPNFDFDNAIRIGPIVLENELTLTPTANPLRAANGADGYDVVRRGSRLIYDSPTDIVRYKAGDLSPSYAGFQTSPDMIGLSAERSYAQLRPGESIRPTGQHAFKLERPANVDILTDGVIIRRLHLAAGSYNLSDLPIGPGANKVTLLIEDDTGERRTLEFNQFSGQDLLAPGLSEWQFAAGAQSIRAPARSSGTPLSFAYHEPEYLWKEPILTGFYKTGITPSVTAGVDAQADSRVAMGGGSIAVQTTYGFVSLDLSGSFGASSGAGFAGRAAYELVNVRGEGGLNQSFRLAAEYQSAAFTTVGGYAPPQDHAASVGALYSRAFTEDLSASLSGTLYLSRDALYNPSSWDADVTISERITPSLSGSLSLGYSEGSSVLTGSNSCCQSALSQQGVHAFARIVYRPDPISTLSLTQDTNTRTARATYTRNETAGGASWNVLADTAYNTKADGGDINAGIGYAGNRGDISLSHSARVDGLTASNGGPRSTDERSSLRLETGFATADGAWSFGKPISNSFAIVETHESLAGREIALGSRDREIGHSDWIAPALISDLAPFSQRRVEFDVPDLPAGYDLGAGAFDFHGPYKAGYRVMAGSAYTVTSTGTLMGRDGAPLPLLGGTAYEREKGSGRQVELFTNKAGKFGAQGL